MDKTFFDLLDLERQGLEKVKTSVKNENYEHAAEEFLAYMRNRRKPVYYKGWETRANHQDFDTTQADKVLKRHIVHYDVGEDIDWHLDPHGDPEWTYCLNRHEYFTTLGRAYWYTGNEKYTKAFKELILDWIHKNPMPDLDWLLMIDKEKSRSHFMQQGNWRPLTIGIRLYTAWCPCFYYFIDSPLFTPEFHIEMLKAMVNHARHLRRYYTRHVNYFNVSPNWGLMEANGLAHMGILFPEFKEAEDWKNTALSRLEEQVRMQVLPDGVHVERCSGYHLVSTFCILQIAELAVRNDLRISDTWSKNLEKMINFVLYLMKPHGYFPMLSDGDESDVTGERASYGLWEDINNLNMLEDSNDLRYVLKAGARMFDRPDMLYMATLGKKGTKPAHNSISFPDGGFYVSRTGWDIDDMYMAVNCGLMGVYDQACVHGHADALSIDVSAFGKTMLIDPGRYKYEGPYRLWFESTSAHNTVAVDGADQSEIFPDGWKFVSMAVPTNKSWATSEQFDYFDGSHDGYQRLSKPVTHRRRILFVKPDYWIVVDDLTGKGKHKMELFWHFTEKGKLEVNEENLEAIVDYEDDVSLLVKPVDTEKMSYKTFEGQEDPIQGWVSYDYAVKVPAPVLCYEKNGQVPARFTTLLRPFKGDKNDFDAVWSDDVLEITRSGKKEIVIFSDEKNYKANGWEFDGEFVYAAFDSKGNLKNCYSANSSFIKYKDEILLDATVRVKQNTFAK